MALDLGFRIQWKRGGSHRTVTEYDTAEALFRIKAVLADPKVDWILIERV